MAAMVVGSRPGEQVESNVRRADSGDLLNAYQSALALAAALPGSRWRPRWGLSRFLVEHIRGRVEALIRGYRRRLALGQDDGDDAQDLEALENFAASLPPRLSKLWGLLPLFLTVGVSQVLIAVFGNIEQERKALADVSQVFDLNPAHLYDGVDALLHSSVTVALDLYAVITLSVYVVLRPQLAGFRLKRIILDMPGALRGRAQETELGTRGRDIGVHGRERALFEALEIVPPGESELDLWVKILPVAFWAPIGIYLLVGRESALPGGILILMGCTARLAWLVRRYRERRPVRPAGA